MIGGIKCGLDIWEMPIIPSLLNNAGTWTNISDKSIDRLNSLQNTFLQTLLGAGRACPILALCWDTATLVMKIWIQKAKLAMVHHIKGLDKTSLAKQIYEEQLSFGWPGLIKECGDIMKEWRVQDIIKSDDFLRKINGRG
jgi:hypothetical protein